MTITLQAVNELIASLESAGELSIREQKFLKLAKAFKQLAAENVALKEEISNITFMRDDDFFGSTQRAQEVMGRLVNVKTPATDRIVAGIKADGAKAAGDYLKLEAQHMPVVERLMMQDAAEICNGTAARLREGADK